MQITDNTRYEAANYRIDFLDTLTAEVESSDYYHSPVSASVVFGKYIKKRRMRLFKIFGAEELIKDNSQQFLANYFKRSDPSSTKANYRL